MLLAIASSAHAIIGPITMTGPTVTTPGGTVAAAGTTVPVNVAFTATVSGSGIVADTVDVMTLYEMIGGVRTKQAVVGYPERFRAPDYDIPYDDSRSGTLVANLGPGIHELFLTAGSYQGQSLDSAHVFVTITLNSPPNVALTSPANGTTVQIGGGTYTMTVTGTASPTYGTLQKTEVWVDGSLNSTLTGAAAATVSTTVSLAGGAHTLALKAYNNTGVSATTPTANVFVNRPPSVAITSPAATSVIVWNGSGANISISGTASDPDTGDSVSKTELLVNGASVQTLTGAAATAVSTSYAAATAGTYVFQLRASDAHGGVTLSNAASVVVDIPPSATMSAPANGAIYQITAGSTYAVAVTGSASDSDGSVANIQLLVDGVSVTTVAGSSISTSYPVAAGTHTFQLKATDNQGVAATGGLVSVYVNRPPTVTLNAPSSTVINWTGTSVPIPIGGAASDPDSGDVIAKTEVLVNSASVQTLTGAAATTINTSYTVTATGTYLIQLRSTDSHGGVTMTTGYSIDVNAPPAVTLSSPANGANFLTDPQGQVAVPVTGSATDSDGSVASIKILVDGTVVNTVSAASVSTSQSFGVGTHTVQLQAIDNQGNSTNSAISTLTVTGSLALMSLPQVSTAKAGTIKDQQDVVAGKAIYRTSIPMPPGVNGMVPSVSLSYGGGVDIGYLGVGWSLSATSSIERCPPTIVQDGRVDTVRFTTSDRLCLDGKRLQLATPPPAGCTGGDCFNTAYWDPSAEYRTEIESFVRVKHYGNGFQVYTKDGRIHLYGDVADTTDTDAGAASTQVFSTQRTNAPTGSAVHTWMLRDTQDRFGNAIDYTYVKDTASGEFYLRYIRYGANANAGQAHFAKVQFDYAPRNDANVYYIAGGRADKTVQLTNITTFTDTQSDGSGGSQALQYTLNYDYSPTSGRSRVVSLVECGASSSDCLPPTTFKYGEPNPAVTPGFNVDRGVWAGPPLEDALNTGHQCNALDPTAWGNCNYAVSDMFISADFNGDGLNDMITKYPSFAPGVLPLSIYINNGSGFNSPVPIPFNGVTVDSSYFVVLTGDFDGDGQTDIILAHTGPAASGLMSSKYGYARLSDWKICYSRLRQGNGFQCQEWAAPATMLSFDPAEIISSRVYDFDGDGRDDIFIASGLRHSQTGGTAWITQDHSMLCMSTGTGFSCNPSGPIIDMSAGVVADGYVSSPAPVTSVPTDMDGDGRLDVASWTGPYPAPCIKGDGPCNGGYSYDQTGAWIRSYTAEGTANIQQAWAYYDLPEAAGTSVLNAILGGMAVGDLNGDGYSDLFIYEQVNPTIGMRYRMCQGVGNSSVGTCIPVTLPADAVAARPYPLLVGDYDGDGLPKAFMQRSLLGQGFNNKMCTIRSSGTAATATCGPEWINAAFPTTTPQSLYYDFSEDIEWTHAGYLDFSGNGLSDWVLYTPGGPVDPNNTGGAQKPGQWHVYSPASQAKPNEALDRLVSVTDGLGKKTQFQYALPGDSTVYSADALDRNGNVVPVTYPERRVPRMGVLVKAMLVDNGQGGTVERDYHYSGATRDMQGRGYLGFAEVDVTEPVASTKTTQWFSKAWPNIGAVTSSLTTYNGGGSSKPIALTINTPASQVVALFNTGAATGQLAWQSNSLNTVCPYVSASTTSKWDIDAQNSPIATTTTTVGSLDVWCNTTASTVQTSGEAAKVYTTVSGATFHNDLTNWFIGQPVAVAVTKTRDGACVVRRTSTSFDPVTGVTASQIVEPHGDPNQPASSCTATDADSLYTLTATYNRTNTDGSPNNLGLLRLTTQSWLDPVSQTTVTRTPQQVTTFEAKGRFAQTVQNALGQAQTTLYDDRYGTPTQHTDLNGLVTTETTDAFGQETVTLDPVANEHRHVVRQCDASCPAGAVAIVSDDTLHLNSPGNYTRFAVPALSYHDNGGRVLRSVRWGFDGRQIVADQRYDARGRHVQTDHPHFASDASVLANTLAYDDLDRVTSSTVYGETGDSRVTSTSYAGRVTTTTNPANQSKVETKDTLGLLELATDAAGNTTSYGRDPFGNLAKVTDPNGNVVTIVYDRLGRRASLQDPDLGLVTERVDPPGRTYWTQSPRQRAAGQSTTVNFDVLDRMTHRLEPDLESYWVYDTAAHGVGELADAYTWVAAGLGAKNYDRVHTYDTLSRPSMTVTALDVTYTTGQSYDTYGRPLTTTQQRGTATRSFTDGYNAMGVLSQLTNEAGTSLWQETSQDAWGHEKTALEGALALTRAYDGHTANLTSASWSVAASNQERYSETQNVYDVLNNLKQRNGRWNYNDPNTNDPQRSYQDVFSYDVMNRLQTALAWSQPQETFSYDAIGNLTSKTSVANGAAYAYPTGANAVGPHAVQSIATLGSYGYDADGNLVSAPNAVSAAWTSFDMPLTLTKASNSDSFVYGPEHQRVKQVRSSGTTLYYAGGIEVESSSAGVTMKTYWPGGLGVNIDAPAGPKMYWTPTDKLGNVRGYIDASGNVVEMLDYDAWGKRRNPSGIGTPDSLDGQTDDKGFTGHEMLDNVDLVHMNGRVYDPFIGRFLSADPTVQSPQDSQSYNRYTYVWNNPTNLTDPTGFEAACPAESVCAVSSTVVTHRDWTSAAPGATTTTTTIVASVNGATATAKVTVTSNSLGITAITETRTGGGVDAKVPGSVAVNSMLDKAESYARMTRNDLVDAIPFVGPDLAKQGKLADILKFLDPIQNWVDGMRAAMKGDLTGALLSTASVSKEAAEARTLSGPVYKTTKEATAAAEALGFKRINETVQGQAVFRRGNDFITRDVDGHNGGAWKMADSVKDLSSKATRAGTFDSQLNRIGD